MTMFHDIHAINSVRNSVEKPFYVTLFMDRMVLNFAAVVTVLQQLYLEEGMTEKEALLLAIRDAGRNGFFPKR